MKTSTLIWYIVIAAVVYFLIYKAYKNYQASGNIFKSSDVAVTPSMSDPLTYNYTGLPTWVDQIQSGSDIIV